MFDAEPTEHTAIREGDSACAHERVYSGERHPTAIPIWFFVCAKCGRCGKASFDYRDPEAPNKKPPIDMPRFAQAMFDFHGERYFLDWLAKRKAQPERAAAEQG